MFVNQIIVKCNHNITLTFNTKEKKKTYIPTYFIHSTDQMSVTLAIDPDCGRQLSPFFYLIFLHLMLTFVEGFYFISFSQLCIV